MKQSIKSFLVCIQILLLITFSISSSYLLKESSGSIEGAEKRQNSLDGAQLLALLGKLLFGKNGFVNALETSDLSAGSWTCLESKSGEVCQEFVASECNSLCTSDCVPSTRNNVAQCKVGTCYDSREGTCQTGSPQALCTGNNGTWFDDPYGNVAECRRGCCLIGQQASFITEQQCTRQASLLGTSKLFKPEVANEVACLALGQSREEGACVYGTDTTGKNLCRFTTKEVCIQTIKGAFHSGFLCSHPQLNTACGAQKSTGCVSGKDEVYWFDSCGNRENIYDAQKPRSWNNGRILMKEQSCALGSGNNYLANARVCGNCNALESSICKKANSGEAAIGDFVCKDLSCVDEWGNTRKHGESWCRYQGSTGLEGNRATDTVGSRHFRQTCLRGDIADDACADFRNEVCVESKTSVSGGSYSTAACTINRWQECLAYNNPQKPELKDKCSTNPYCFIKRVSVGSDFSFNLCTPKYPPGFLLEENGRGEGAETICSLASQTCTKVMVKKLTGWKCQANCQCDTPAFTQQMNDLCISLGDCGAKANYLGEISESYRISGAGVLDGAYLGGVKRYADESLFKGRVAEVGALAASLGSLGRSDDIGFAAEPSDPTAKTRGALNLPIGAAGTLLGLAAAYAPGALGYLAVVNVAGSFSLGVGASAAAAGEAASAGTAAASGAIAPQVAGFAGVLAGAAMGFALTSFLIDITGVGRGLHPAVTYSLIAAGTVGGAIMGFSAYAGGKLAAACATGYGCVVVAIVVIIILILKFVFNVGKVKHIQVSFQCKPWQAPLGGTNCGKCGSDGRTCTRYACSSLGQTCTLINENTDAVACIDSNPNDVASPVLNPLTSLISVSHSYENVSERGFTIRNIQTGSGCVEPYSTLIFGLQLNEPGQCRASTSSTALFNEMEGDFGISSLFRHNHSVILPVPDLNALGYAGYIPANASGNFNLFVRCQDKRGNVNLAPYVINFCVQKGVDVSPPAITHREPVYEYVSFAESEKNITAYTSEPASCRWDVIDGAYDSLRNTLACLDDPDQQGVFGWPCTARVPLQIKNDSRFFIRCKDQPWLNSTVIVFSIGSQQIPYYANAINYTHLQRVNFQSGNPGITNITLPETRITDIIANGTNRTQSRNVNQQSYPFILRKSTAPLRIDSITPNNQTLIFGTVPASVSIQVQTSGGVDGTAACSYVFGNSTILFFETWRTTHKQVFQSLFPGVITLPIICEDLAGNTATTTARFSVAHDTRAPRVTRTYSAGTILTIITDEPSQCIYGTSSCNFESMNGTLMSGTQRIHTAVFDKERTYYVKCKDSFLNGPGSACNIIVRRSQADVS
ncbi:hypothetical protein HYZ97_04270 [Candidatus Pacearchaeota archaeon]|nr:hypothetical protein [Candidatus Pacearchaeota archaeon]